MGKKSSYFRHSFDAHKDPKIMELIERGGIKALGVYFVLLELYGSAFAGDDSAKIQQKITARLVANATGLRADSAQTCIELIADCKLIDALCFKSEITYFQVAIPNFLKYYGSYIKTETMKSPNKRKEKQSKEKKSKEKQKKEFTSPLAPFFEDKEIIDWLNNGIEKIQNRLIEIYNDDFLKTETLKAYEWQLGKKRQAGSFLTGWFERCAKESDKRSFIDYDTQMENLLTGGFQ